MVMNIAGIIMKPFRIEKGGVGFVPCRSAPAPR
jgi:hypothetical protein